MKVPFELNLSNASLCLDPGLNAIKRIPNHHLLNFLLWCVITLSFEQLLHLFVIALHSKKKFTFWTEINPYKFPTGLALLWSMSTSISQILIGLTSRNDAAILTKSFHVAIEITFLLQLFQKFGMHLLSAVFALNAVLILIFASVLPCSVTINWASYGGIVLDTTNLISLLIFAYFSPYSKELRYTILAFGLHAFYFATFIIVYRIPGSNEFLASFRLIGAFFNILAIEVFIRCIQNIQYPKTTSKMKSVDFLTTSDSILCIWGQDGLILKNYHPEQTKEINVFDPYTTGYTSTLFLIVSILPFWGHCILSPGPNKHVVQLQWSVCVGLCFKTFVDLRKKIPDEVVVLNWNNIRIIYVILFLVSALILGVV